MIKSPNMEPSESSYSELQPNFAFDPNMILLSKIQHCLISRVHGVNGVPDEPIKCFFIALSRVVTCWTIPTRWIRDSWAELWWTERYGAPNATRLVFELSWNIWGAVTSSFSLLNWQRQKNLLQTFDLQKKLVKYWSVMISCSKFKISIKNPILNCCTTWVEFLGGFNSWTNLCINTPVF